MKIRTIPGVGPVGFPDEMSDRDIDDAIRRNMEPPSAIRQAGRQAGAVLAGIPAGLIEGIAAVPQGAGELIGSEGLKDVGRWLRGNPVSQYLTEVPADQRDEQGNPLLGRRAGEIAGQVGAMMLPGVAQTRLPAAVARGASVGLSALQQASQVSRDAEEKRAQGMTISPEQSQRAAWEATPAALLDLLPLHRFAGVLPGFAKSEALVAAKEAATQPLLRSIPSIAASSAIEGATEAAQQVWANAAIQHEYDAKQSLTEGLRENAVAGGGVGAWLEMLNQMLRRRTGRAIQSRRQRLEAPEILPGVEAAIGIRTGAEGQPDIRHIAARTPPVLDTLATALHGEPFDALAPVKAKNLTTAYEMLRAEGMADPAIVDLMSKPVDLTAQAGPEQATPSSGAIDRAALPDVRLDEEGRLISPAPPPASFLDILAQGDRGERAIPGSDIVGAMLAESAAREPGGVTPGRPVPGVPRPLPDVRLTPEGTIAAPETPGARELRRRGVEEIAKPPQQQVIDLVAEQPSVEPAAPGPGEEVVQPSTVDAAAPVEGAEKLSLAPSTAPTTPQFAVAGLRKQVEAGENPPIALDLVQEMHRLGVDDLIAVRLVDSIGKPDAAGKYANRIVTLSLASADPKSLIHTLNHEAVHAMKEAGLFTDAEWDILSGAMSPSRVLTEDERDRYAKLYGNDPAALQEEAVARGLEQFAAGRLDLDAQARAAAGQKIGLLDRLGNFFRRNDLTTPASVAKAFQSGEIGGRPISKGLNDNDYSFSNRQGVEFRAGETETAAPETADGKAAAKAAPPVAAEDPFANLLPVDTEGEVQGTPPGDTSSRLSVKQLPVPAERLFAEPDARSPLRREAELALNPNRGKEGLGGAGLAARQSGLDSRAAIEALSREAGNDTSARKGAIAAVRAADVSADLAAAGLKHGGFEYVGTPGNGYFRAVEGPNAPFGDKGFLTGLNRNGKLDRFFHYVAASRETGLIDRPDYKRSMSEAQRVAFLDLGRDPEIKSAADKWKRFNDSVVDLVQASGRIDKITASKWKQTLYHPFYAVDPETGEVTGQNQATIASAGQIHKIKGGEKTMVDPVEAIVKNVNSMLSLAMNNEAKVRIMRDGLQLGYMKQAIKGSTSNQLVTVYRDGKPVKLHVTDPLLYGAVSASRIQLDPAMKILNYPAHFLRESVTLSPPFMVRNIMRDSLETWARGYTDVPFAGVFRNMGEAWNESPRYRALERMGVIGAGIRGEGAAGTAENIRRSMVSVDKGSRNPISWLADLSKKSEAVNRMAVYEAVMKRTGGDEAQAAYEARELLNFNRRGSSPIVQYLHALIPFQNAGWQGADAVYRAMRGHGANPQMQRQLIARGLSMSAMTMLYTIAASQMEAWQKATQQEREQYWFVPTPTGDALRIPVPFEFGFAFKTIPERLTAMMMDQEDGRDFVAAMRRFAENTLKVDWRPQTLKPIIEAGTNYDTFRQRPIEQAWMQKLEKNYRADERTSEIAQALAPYTTLSPVKIDHLMRGYLGTSAMYAANLIDMLATPNPAEIAADVPNRNLSQLPVFGSLFQRKDGGRALMEFYKIREAAEQAANTLRFMDKSASQLPAEERERMGRLSEAEAATRQTDESVAEMSRMERQVRADAKAGRMTRAQERETLDRLRQYKTQAAEPVVAALNQLAK